MNTTYRLIGGVLLVAGTTIGAGMLALPIVTGFAGFWPSMLLFIVYWLYMTFTAFLMLEINLWMEEHTNLITMAKRTLGRGGQILSWIIYLFLLYTLTTAYLAGGGPIFIEAIETFTGWQFPAWVNPFPLLIIFGFFVYQGTHSVDFVNRLLMLGLAISYVLIVVFLFPHIQASLLMHTNWTAIWMAVSIVSTSFGFHIIIPTLTDYLHRNIKQLKLVLIIGSLIPLFVYISWELLTLGIIPLQGASGLTEGYQKGLDGATLLSTYLGNNELSLLARLFSLFAIVTSFLGVSLSLRDFLADGLRIQKTQKGRLILYLLTFIPPLAITLIDPRAFLNALEYAGAFGVMTLLGLFPILMVWRGRYVQRRTGEFRAPGGQWTLALAFAISLAVIGLEIANKTGYLTFSSFNLEQVSQP
jgi:tyrosine-specific transport protein